MEVDIKLNGKVGKIIVSLVFASQNPQTNQYNVNISYWKDGKQRNISLDCRKDETGYLVKGIREGKISDLSGYTAHERN